MMDDEFKKLDLNFEKRKKNKEVKLNQTNQIENFDNDKNKKSFFNKFDKKQDNDELINETNKLINKPIKDIDKSLNKKISKNNSINNLETDPDLANESLHSFIDRPIKFITEESRIKKRWKGETLESRARKSLFLLIFWSLILFFAIIFGTNSIWLSVKNVSCFIQDINNENINKAIGSFFLAFAHVCESLMFLFFMLLSLIKLIYNSKPWFKYRKSTLHERKEKRKIKKQKRIEKEAIRAHKRK